MVHETLPDGAGGSGPTLLWYVTGPHGDEGERTVSVPDLETWGDITSVTECTTSVAAEDAVGLQVYDLSNTLTAISQVRLQVRKVRNASGAIVDGATWQAWGNDVAPNGAITFDTWDDDTADTGRGSLNGTDDTQIVLLTPGTYRVRAALIAPVA